MVGPVTAAEPGVRMIHISASAAPRCPTAKATRQHRTDDPGLPRPRYAAR
jgi:hypothetical protein